VSRKKRVKRVKPKKPGRKILGAKKSQLRRQSVSKAQKRLGKIRADLGQVKGLLNVEKGGVTDVQARFKGDEKERQR